MSKKVFEHPAPQAGEPTRPSYWRSLDELADTPGFREQLAREFPEGASSLEGVDRRQFMKLMAASFALGGLGLFGVVGRRWGYLGITHLTIRIMREVAAGALNAVPVPSALAE